MSKTFVTLKGTEALMAKLKAMDDEINSRALGSVLDDAADKMVELAKGHAPHRSGELRDSIERSDVDTGNGKRTVLVGTNKWYAHFVEFGTVKSPAQPFIRPAYDEIQGEVMSRMKDGVKEATR